ncbi:unnamed protein product [Periconia digitata]|uniref:Uncharacterized protein n=1 Tax=Periconia digitata TaxID=1303443 RepID=A0A9W4UM15_9PLEO|nr:unnamed protein product [Periconia digitata]
MLSDKRALSMPYGGCRWAYAAKTIVRWQQLDFFVCVVTPLRFRDCSIVGVRKRGSALLGDQTPWVIFQPFHPCLSLTHLLCCRQVQQTLAHHLYMCFLRALQELPPICIIFGSSFRSILRRMLTAKTSVVHRCTYRFGQ